MLILNEYVKYKELIDILCINEYFVPNITMKLLT